MPSKELKTGIRGLSIICSDDGVWLSTKSDTGHSVMLNLISYATERGNSIIGSALLEWCKQTHIEAKVDAVPAPTYGAFCLSTETKQLAAVRQRLQEPAVRRLLSYLLADHIKTMSQLDVLKKYVYYGKAGNIPAAPEGPAFDERALANDNLIRRLHCVLGIVTEGVELSELMVKELFQGGAVSQETWLKELGDPCWYIAIAADTIGLSFDEVLEANMAKLAARYKKADGTIGFTEAKAQTHKGD